MLKKFRNTWIILLFLCLGVQDAHANAMIPSFLLVIPMLFFLLIPVVFIEALVFKCYFSQMKYTDLLLANAGSNVYSTLLGMPIYLVVMLISTEIEKYISMINIILVLGIFLYVISARSESKFLITGQLSSFDPKKVRKVTWIANLISYIFIYAVFIYLSFIE